MKSISVGDSFRASWALTKKHFGFLFLMLLAFFGIGIVHGILQALFQSSEIVVFLLNLAFFYIDILMGIGMINVYLKAIDGKIPQWSDLLEKKDLGLRFLGLVLLIVAIMLIPMAIIGIIVGILFGITSVLAPHSVIVIMVVIIASIAGIIALVAFMARYFLASYLMIDKNYKIIQSIKESRRLTKGKVWIVCRFILAEIGIVLLGMLCLVVGLFWAIPTAKLMMASLYRQLAGEDTEEVTVVEEIAIITEEPASPLSEMDTEQI